MNDYNKNTFLTYTDKETGYKTYFMRVGKQTIEVPEDVFYVCYHSYRKQLRDNHKDEEFGLLSIDQESEDGITLLDKLGNEERNFSNDKLEKVIEVIDSLDVEDKILVTDLLLEERKEREVAEKYHLTQQAVNKRKKKILDKIKKGVTDK
ncbi:hypothetical protein [Anaerorhabdus sp.]|uniref:hypothetical protein n=1 Tax=Anaerorhabdus sp. TaxID=1872524 RepID=UPI002FCCAE39